MFYALPNDKGQQRDLWLDARVDLSMICGCHAMPCHAAQRRRRRRRLKVKLMRKLSPGLCKVGEVDFILRCHFLCPSYIDDDEEIHFP